MHIFEWFLDMNFHTQSTRLQVFSNMTLHLTLYVAPGDVPFSTQSTVIWIFPSVNIYMSSCVVCGVLFGVVYRCTNQISFLWLRIICIFSTVFYVVLPVTFFTLFLFLQVFFITLTAMTSKQRWIEYSLKHLKSTRWQCFIRICCVNPFSEEFV